MEDYYSKPPIVLYEATVCDTPISISINSEKVSYGDSSHSLHCTAQPSKLPNCFQPRYEAIFWQTALGPPTALDTRAAANVSLLTATKNPTRAY
jgi:hypothetical protein